MSDRAFVVQARLKGHRYLPEFFESEALARARAVYLGATMDCVVVGCRALKDHDENGQSMAKGQSCSEMRA